MSKPKKKLENMTPREVFSAADDAAKRQRKAERSEARKSFWNRVSNTELGMAIKGFIKFWVGSTALVTSGFAIYQGYYGNYPKWGGYVLIICGATMFIVSAFLLGKLFASAAKE